MLKHEEPMNSVNYNHLITLSSSDKIVTKVKINARRKRRQLQKLIKKVIIKAINKVITIEVNVKAKV